MNLLLFESPPMGEGAIVRVTGRQHLHLRQTLKAGIGDTVRVGKVGGLMGMGTVVASTDTATELAVTLDGAPPPPLPLKLVLALPRPKMLRRILQSVASLGIKELHLLNSYRVDKSYWGTPWLQPDAMREQLLLGLEQAGDTLLPVVHQHRLFKPWVEDELPAVIAGTSPLVAHPYTHKPCPRLLDTPVTLAIGPEGGFIPYEVEKLQQCGFQAVSLGPRILRVETAIPVLVSRIAMA